MKTKHFIMVICLLAVATPSQAQIFKKLGKAAERAAERTIERRVEKETTKSTDRTLDTIIEAPKKKKKRRKKRKKKNGGNIIGGNSNEQQTNTSTETTVNSNFDFTAGNVPIFNDNFASDNMGDFPANWDTNGSGELVTINDVKWLRLGNKATVLPMLNNKLPENYTIEFDLFMDGIDKKTSSQAFLKLLLHDTSGFKKPTSFSMVEISPC